MHGIRNASSLELVCFYVLYWNLASPLQQIFQYRNGRPKEVEGPWEKRLLWNGSVDLQDLSIWILNVSLNDSGTYRCDVFRQFKFDYFTPSVNKTKVIQLKVYPTGEASVYF